MPPKVKITKKEIVNSALELVKKEGIEAINARSIAASLGCSTQPIFSNFSTMDELQDAVIAAAYDLYLTFLKNEAKTLEYPKYKSFGMAYIRFSKDEKELFKLLFMRDRNGSPLSPTVDFTESVEMIQNSNGVSYKTAELMHLEMWAFVHGIAVMLATSFHVLEWELISDMLTDAYMGIRSRHVKGDKQ